MAYGPDGSDYPDAAPAPTHSAPLRPRPVPRVLEEEPPPLRSRTQAPVPARPPGQRPNRRKGKKPRKVLSRGKRIRRRYLWRPLIAVFVLVFGYVAVTLEPYLTYPGSDTVSARVAEWGRDHHLSTLVTWLENETYTPPPVGGNLSAQQVQALQGATAAPTASKEDLPAAIAPLAAGSIPDEGVWHPVVYGKDGSPVVEWAGLRPDAKHTSELAYVAWMNQKALTFRLHPGSQQPGGSFATPDELRSGQRTGLVATWNGGFKVNPNDSLGGYYEDGRTVRPLVDGKAAEVFYRDGSVKIGEWGRDLSMTPQVIGVRQNLSLLVDNGQVTAATNSGSGAQWGVTVKNAFFVPRSGIGITASGDIVYAGGPTLSVSSLAQLLKQAGAVDAMELDINAEWTSFMYYTVTGGGNPADPTPAKLWNFAQPATRYYQPSSRDFVAVYLR